MTQPNLNEGTVANATVPSKTGTYTVHPAPYPLEVPGGVQFGMTAFYTALFLPPVVLLWLSGFSVTFYPLVLAVTFVPSYILFMWIDSITKCSKTLGTPAGRAMDEYITFNDEALKSQYAHKAKIPMQVFFEAYFDKKIDIKGDMLDHVMENRHDWASFQFTIGHLEFLVKNFVPEVTFHTRDQDKNQVRDHYDRGNDFYEAFLGPSMIYTSGIMNDMDSRESLEKMQENKMNLVLNKIQLKSGEKMLDIGCGWGTLGVHAAKNYGASVLGVTLAREQTDFAKGRALENGVEGKAEFLCADYRDIPRPSEANGTKYNKITCLEMAEHVGVLKFNSFLKQVYELLEDDGVFYLQIAGLRRSWQYEDLIWGLFMNKYVFPGADASCPLFWNINQLEYAGFEVSQVDTIGVHYSATIERWYRNWMKPANKDHIVAKYGERWWRIWEFFLAYSTIISRQGSATCYQIVCHKNKNAYDRAGMISGYNLKRLMA